MSAGYVLTPEATANVEAILLHVEREFGGVVGDRVFSDLLRAFEFLAERPEAGRHRPELWPESYRFWPVGPSIIAYRGDVRPVRIIAVDRAERDWPSLDRPVERPE